MAYKYFVAVYNCLSFLAPCVVVYNYLSFLEPCLVQKNDEQIFATYYVVVQFFLYFSPRVVQSNPVVKSEKATFWYFDLLDDVDEEDKTVD